MDRFNYADNFYLNYSDPDFEHLYPEIRVEEDELSDLFRRFEEQTKLSLERELKAQGYIRAELV